MGSRKHGTWAQLYEDVHDHEKTRQLAKAIHGFGIPEDCARDVVVAQLHRLACWALRDNGVGRIGQLTPLEFAAIVRWMRPRHNKALYAAWMDSGFIDAPGTPEAGIHDFREYFWHVLRKRSEDQDPGAGPAESRRPSGADPAPIRRPSGAHPAESRRLARLPARASPETGNRKEDPPTPPQGGFGFPPSQTRQDGPAEPPTIGILAGILDRLCALWAELERPGVRRRPRRIRQAVAAALDRSGGDEQLAGEAVREYFRLDDSWIRDRGFDVFGFVKRIPTCVDRAIAARESRRRDEAQRAQADLMAVMAPVASCAAPQLKARAIERTRGLTDAELEQERMRALRFLNGGGS